ncbi:MAG: hypothetical protein IPN49_16305 [Saprospiraceae bacterium]|nr:hypothetical protein [Saprospiraceae bacterium]
MYRYFTKTDGLKVYIKPEDILAYEEMEDHVLIITVIGDFEVINTIDEIFNKKKQNFSNN